MATDMVQMNTRIGRSLKERGDAAIERAGMTPSQAVRKLWEFAACNAHNPRAIQNLLEVESKDEAARNEAEEERARRREVVHRGANIYLEVCKQVGIDPSKFTADETYEELRENALLERLRERGLDA